ncbi:MAG: ATP-binding protein [Patescibacteria group bacterium]
MDFIGITLTPVGWSSIAGALIMLIIATVMVIFGRNKIQNIWGVFCIVVAIWIGAFYGVTISKDSLVAEMWWKISYIGVILIPFTFMHFVFEFIDFKKFKKSILILAYAVALIFIFLDIKTNLIVSEVRFLFNELYYGQPGLLHPYFMIIYLMLVCYAFYLVYKKYNENKDDKIFRRKAVYFFIANLIAFTGGSLNFLPIYGIEIPPVSNISVVFGALLLAYAIVKHSLFDTKVILTEALVFILWVILAIELLFSNSLSDLIFKSIVLVLTIILGIFLMKGVRYEIKLREEKEKMVGELELANEKLKNLDQQKSDFISIASHQLRTPLTAIKGYASMILDGTYGRISVKTRVIIDKIFNSSQRLIYIVNDMLDVSRMEGGKFKYTFEDINIISLVNDVIEELKININPRKLKLSFDLSLKDAKIIISADYGKLRQAITNVIDNAIKYTDKGFVVISIKKIDDKNSMVLSVKDSGIGMTEEQIKAIFVKFERAENAIRTHTEGSGLGLYVAKEIIKSNGGVIWATSDGLKRGSQFYIEFPIKKG